ncbi:hypothetical protein CAC42_7948 [Sphaceloma murrayae]|uniref:C2H2-type domain-containing protein n=1 Tax=Sphaceloma murrayae TaxID=2082308 RepID=A0A2K1QY52_9PEZI|nr:hypothetical protein CAC42_7948 [Sphaceloma murrayae]
MAKACSTALEEHDHFPVLPESVGFDVHGICGPMLNEHGSMNEASEPCDPWAVDLNSLEEDVAAHHADATSKSIESLKEDVELVLKQLVDLSFLVRRSGTHARLERADKLFDPSIEGVASFKRYLLAILYRDTGTACPKANANALVEDVFQEASVDPFCLHLLNANLKRRHRFSYAQRHEKRLGGTRNVSKFSGKLDMPQREEVVTTMSQPTTAEGPGQNDYRKHSDLEASNRCEAQSHLATFVTEDNDRGLNNIVAARVSQAAGYPFRKTSLSLSMLQTLAPKRVRTTRPMEVRVMMSLLSQAESLTDYRKHLAEDLQPYTCPIPTCPEGMAFYTTTEDWKKHMMSMHVGKYTWQCLACTSAPVTFDGEEDFIEHTRMRHPHVISDAHVHQYAEICRKPGQLSIDKCPLCRKHASHDHAGGITALLDHMAEHIHDFSLHSLPWARIKGEARNPFDDTERLRIRHWVSQTNREVVKPIGYQGGDNSPLVHQQETQMQRLTIDDSISRAPSNEPTSPSSDLSAEGYFAQTNDEDRAGNVMGSLRNYLKDLDSVASPSIQASLADPLQFRPRTSEALRQSQEMPPLPDRRFANPHGFLDSAVMNSTLQDLVARQQEAQRIRNRTWEQSTSPREPEDEFAQWKIFASDPYPGSSHGKLRGRHKPMPERKRKR